MRNIDDDWHWDHDPPIAGPMVAGAAMLIAACLVIVWVAWP